MSFTVFLGNLPTWVTADDIKGWLTAENLVADAIKVIRNPETQESKGFAFIEAPNAEEMNSIIRRFDRAPLEDRLLRANPAQPPKPKGLVLRPGGNPGMSFRIGRANRVLWWWRFTRTIARSFTTFVTNNLAGNLARGSANSRIDSRHPKESTSGRRAGLKKWDRSVVPTVEADRRAPSPRNWPKRCNFGSFINSEPRLTARLFPFARDTSATTRTAPLRPPSLHSASASSPASESEYEHRNAERPPAESHPLRDRKPGTPETPDSSQTDPPRAE